MKKNINKLILRLTLTVAVTFCSMALFAQPPGGPPPGGGGTTGTTPPCWEPECVPIDGGIAFLLIAGAALGSKKLYTQLK